MRGSHNRVGFAVQLGTARFLGAFLDDPTQAPSAVTATIARQLSEMPPPSLEVIPRRATALASYRHDPRTLRVPRSGGGRRRRISADPLALCAVLDRR